MNPTTAIAFFKRWALWFLAALVMVAMLIWALLPRPLVVEVATVRTGRFEQSLDEDGQLRVKNRYVISAPVAAELIRPDLKVGDTVRKGDVVATLIAQSPSMIDDRNRLVLQQRVRRDEAAQQAAASQLERLHTTLKQTELELQRAQKLANEQFIAPAALDQADLNKRAAAQAVTIGQAQLRVAEYALAESQAALTRTRPANTSASPNAWSLTSPVDGQVVKMHLTSGTPVTAGQALLEIGNTQVMEAVVDVLSSDAIRVTPGTPVRLSYGMGAQPMTGRVSRIEPVAFTKISALGIEEQRVNVVVELDTPADSTRSLGEGFRVDAHITLTAHDQVLLVPSAALIREGLGWQVMLYKNGRAHSQSITVKERNADTAWVESGDRAGVQEGDWVLLYPGTIASGQRIRLKPTRPGQ